MNLERFKRFVKRQANINQYSTRGKITAVNSNGTFNIELLSGEILSYVTPQSLGSNFKYQEGMFVTLENSGGDWQVAGLAAMRGGD